MLLLLEEFFWSHLHAMIVFLHILVSRTTLKLLATLAHDLRLLLLLLLSHLELGWTALNVIRALVILLRRLLLDELVVSLLLVVLLELLRVMAVVVVGIYIRGIVVEILLQGELLLLKDLVTLSCLIQFSCV